MVITLWNLSVSAVVKAREETGREGFAVHGSPLQHQLRRRPAIALKPTDLTPQSFAPYGQIVDAKPDGVPFDPDDAQLELSRGISRFYLMRLKNTPWQFEAITHHANPTQCLGSLHGLPWYWFVARSTIIGATERVDPEKRSQVLKAPGYEYLPPAVEDIRLFRVDGSRFLKLHVGIWHARPLIKEPFMDFYNLKLSNMNEIDHPNYFFKKSKGIVFEVDNPCGC